MKLVKFVVFGVGALTLVVIGIGVFADFDGLQRAVAAAQERADRPTAAPTEPGEVSYPVPVDEADTSPRDTSPGYVKRALERADEIARQEGLKAIDEFTELGIIDRIEAGEVPQVYVTDKYLKAGENFQLGVCRTIWRGRFAQPEGKYAKMTLHHTETGQQVGEYAPDTELHLQR